MKKLINNINLKHIREIIVYGIVGGSAWVSQTICYIILINSHASALFSMFIGNLSGMLVSYYGHVKFTFKKGKFSHSDFIRFIIASLIGLSINVLGVKIVVEWLNLNPHFGIIPTFLTPLITYLISKFWVFR